MKFIEIDINSSLYQEELKLHDKYFRRPLGMSIYDEDLSKEPEARHFGITHDGILIACLQIFPQEMDIVRLKQIAVSAKNHGVDVGTRLMCDTENILLQNGIGEIQLAARKTVIRFYQKLGYAIFGNEFIEVSLPPYDDEKEY